MVISAEEAVRLQQCAKTAERQAVEILVDRVDKAVRAACVAKFGSTAVAVPSYLWGVPTFDRPAVVTQVIAVFKEQGFRVKELDQGKVLVAWSDENADDAGTNVVAAPLVTAGGPASSMIDERCFNPPESQLAPASAVAQPEEARVLQMM